MSNRIILLKSVRVLPILLLAKLKAMAIKFSHVNDQWWTGSKISTGNTCKMAQSKGPDLSQNVVKGIKF